MYIHLRLVTAFWALANLHLHYIYRPGKQFSS